MKKYLSQMIRQECAALNNATLTMFADKDDAAQAFAVRTIYGRLNSFVREYINQLEKETSHE